MIWWLVGGVLSAEVALGITESRGPWLDALFYLFVVAAWPFVWLYVACFMLMHSGD